MKSFLCTSLTLLAFCSVPLVLPGQTSAFSLDHVKSNPFPNELVAATEVDRIAWAFNENGLRNIYVAEGPDFVARKLTNYVEDDGQEFSSVSISSDGSWILYIRGGDFGSNWDDALPVNPLHHPHPPAVELWAVSFEGGEPTSFGEGEGPAISPDGKRLAFIRDGHIWQVGLDSFGDPRKLVSVRGQKGDLQWSVDGMLAFVCDRNDHSFVGIFQGDDEPILWVNPGFSHDHTPRWNAQGDALVFVRQPGSGGEPEAILEDHHQPWSIMRYDLSKDESKVLWEAPKTIMGSPPTTHGRINLHWADSYIIFLSYQDGWPHLYSLPENGGYAKLLTPGEYMAEYISLSANGQQIYFSGNTGPDPLDIDRRHIVNVSVDGVTHEVLTPGAGIEWAPKSVGVGRYVAFIGAGAQEPPMPYIMDRETGTSRMLASDRIPDEFPVDNLVTPSQVIFQSPDGTPIHSTLFRGGNQDEPQPAIVYVHGGPPRQMLLGWHYSSYYSNAYALNQYLASQGFAVLSVNFRLGIGYGYDFHRPVDGGTRGASEYQDIKAAGEWLRSQSFINGNRIGIYGGSYGGHLTAMALGRDSDLFAAGVDIHGVHDRTVNRADRYLRPNSYEKARDAKEALDIAWQSSPVKDVDTWTSPVLIIHADDDRNVSFSQSTDLVQRLNAKGVDLETLVIVDDTHHFMTHKNQMKVNQATAEFLIRKLGNQPSPR